MLFRSILPGYHSLVGIHPSYSFGFVILTTSENVRTFELGDTIIKHLHPAFEFVHEEETRRLYEGAWHSSNPSANIDIEFIKGTLYLTKYLHNSVDVMSVLQRNIRRDRLALWDMGGGHFRYLLISPFLCPSLDRKSTRLNSSHSGESRMPSSA